MLQHFKDFYHWLDVQHRRIPAIPWNLGVTALFLCAAYWASSILIGHTGGENNSALVFVLAVALISLLTSGYAYGIAASIIGTLCINIYFMEPYAAFSLREGKERQTDHRYRQTGSIHGTPAAVAHARPHKAVNPQRSRRPYDNI